MKAKVSELMDGELEPREAARLIAELPAADDGMQAWKTYHLIRDALRSDADLSSSAITDRILASLESEPVVLAPRAAADVDALGHRSRRTAVALSAVASAAAIGVVAWLALTPPQPAQGPVMAAGTTAPAPAASRVPLPEETQNYLLAHQGYSPRGSLQGMAPYVRTVSEQIPVRGEGR